jgi:hypothetical protein
VGSDDLAHDTRSDAAGRRGAPAGLLLGALAAAGGSFWAFRMLDPIIAAFLVILGLTVLVVAVAARDWDRHSTFEERELTRAQKRKAKWEAGKAARDRDRARWEAHQSRRAKKDG